ncbi:MAG: YchJ family protein [Proteobacteria bacterium]|nr:YchJ family protein [Pseudomonadota bacterium]MBU1056850.1 YchJ family protein [Pseudomonadota bacterium]
MTSGTLCPCGSKKPFASCCAPILKDHRKAITAEQLMRSRYSAYTLAKNEYLITTWATETRPDSLDLDLDDTSIKWLELEIEECEGGETGDEKGTVTFTARFLSSGHLCQLHEKSRFVRRQNLWYYLDGETHSTTAKVGRNSPCPCGSEKKYKKCCFASQKG